MNNVLHRMSPTARKALRPGFGLATLAASALLALVLTGCNKPLLGPAEQRTPFDRYDAIRGNYAPQYVEDKFGRRQPNLRARLSPKS
jgi:hypothetical protein